MKSKLFDLILTFNYNWFGDMMLVASNNANKVLEFENILGFKVKSLRDLNMEIVVSENGKTFRENAILKAKEIYEKTKVPTLADDSGLTIGALNGFPGVFTNRFLGLKASSQDRNQDILRRMEGIRNRECYFEVALAYYDGVNLIVKEAKLAGEISYYEHLNQGFGFDSIFLYKGKFLSDMTLNEKNRISPRRIALEKLKLEICKKKLDLIY